MDGGGGGSSGGSCYYSVLGIRKEASSYEIRTAYRKLALRWHPDRWTRNPDATGEANRRFQKIQEAYSVLSDGEKRSMYDAGFLDLMEQDEEMGEFLHELMNMMDKNVGSAKKEESLEDLQRTFVEMFGDDLMKMMEKDDQISTNKRARESGPTGNSAARKRNNSAAGSSCA